MVIRTATAKHRASGIFLIEIALVIMVIGIIATVVLPLLELGNRYKSDEQDRSAIAQIRESLLAYAVRHGGFPGPLALDSSATLLSRTTLAPANMDGSAAVVAASENPYGAVPASLLGSSATSEKGTLWQYDVHPALRADQAFSFSTIGGLAGLHAMGRDAQGTGGSVVQLCRNVNTLMDIERRVRADTATLGDYLRLAAPRIWQTGFETSFDWRDGQFKPTLAADASVNNAWIIARSTASALVVARPNPLAYARLDRSNRVFVGDVPSTEQKASATANRNYRIYEHPKAGGGDAPGDDLRDYTGLTSAVLLTELQRQLQDAGQCARGASTCLNTELYLTVDNSVKGQYMVPATAPATGEVASGDPVGLSVYWTVTEAAQVSPLASPTTAPTSPTASGKQGTIAWAANGSACVPAASTATFTSMPALYLNIFAVLPGGTLSGGSYWLLQSQLLMSDGFSAGMLPSTALDSGSSQAATLRCRGTSPAQFRDRVGGGYELSDASAVSCTMTSD
jgi:type II secretory pathway pseudopilin PulG